MPPRPQPDGPAASKPVQPPPDAKHDGPGRHGALAGHWRVSGAGLVPFEPIQKLSATTLWPMSVSFMQTTVPFAWLTFWPQPPGQLGALRIEPARTESQEYPAKAIQWTHSHTAAVLVASAAGRGDRAIAESDESPAFKTSSRVLENMPTL